MYGSWSTYTVPLQLNNTTGAPYTTYALANLSSTTLTPIVVLSDGNGNTYMPKATNFIDVYSGGSPFTMTQELVQRGVEVQDDEFRIAVSCATRSDCYTVMQYIRSALTSQSFGMPAVLRIKRPSDADYTEWFVQSANIQEDNTHLGRDIKSPLPTLYMKIKITRSPYGSNSRVSYFQDKTNFSNQTKFTLYNGEGDFFNLGDLINTDLEFILPTASSSLGPVSLNIITDDTFYNTGGYPTVLSTGTLAAGATATINTYTYNIQDIDTLDTPLSVIVVADVQSNEVEMRASIQGYNTPYVRTIGTQLSSSGTMRVFQLPPIDISGIYSGMPNYDNSFQVPITISIRNVNRGSTRTYTIYQVTMFRTMGVVQMFPTNVSSITYAATPSVQYRLVSFYDNLNLPAQPLPSLKGTISSSVNANFAYDNRFQYLQGMEVRGTPLRIKKNNSIIYGYIIFMGSSGQIITNAPDLPTANMEYKFSHLYQSVGS